MVSLLSFAHGETSSKIRKLDLRKCQKGQCIQVKAEMAESGNFTPLMSLKGVHLAHYAEGKKNTYSSARGYIDFERDVVMIKSDSQELLFNLKNMSVKVYSLPKI
jgi:hypothetical protein